jgi:hypothetical protein
VLGGDLVSAADEVMAEVLAECLEAVCEDGCGIDGVLAGGTPAYHGAVAERAAGHAAETGHRTRTWAVSP